MPGLASWRLVYLMARDSDGQVWFHICENCGYEWPSSSRRAVCPGCEKASVVIDNEKTNCLLDLRR